MESFDTGFCSIINDFCPEPCPIGENYCDTCELHEVYESFRLRSVKMQEEWEE